jgi:hypothetical protein
MLDLHTFQHACCSGKTPAAARDCSVVAAQSPVGSLPANVLIMIAAASAATAAAAAQWTVENASQWRVVFQTIKFSFAGITLLDKPIDNAVGLWTLTYIDDDFRVLTARSLGRNDGGNVYILAKK